MWKMSPSHDGAKWHIRLLFPKMHFLLENITASLCLKNIIYFPKEKKGKTSDSMAGIFFKELEFLNNMEGFLNIHKEIERYKIVQFLHLIRAKTLKF